MTSSWGQPIQYHWLPRFLGSSIPIDFHNVPEQNQNRDDGGSIRPVPDQLWYNTTCYWYHMSSCHGLTTSYVQQFLALQWRHNGREASQITSLTIVYSTVYSGTDQRKHQNSASLAFVRGIQRWPVNSPHKGPVTRKMLPFDDVIMGQRFPRETLRDWSKMKYIHVAIITISPVFFFVFFFGGGVVSGGGGSKYWQNRNMFVQCFQQEGDSNAP